MKQLTERPGYLSKFYLVMLAGKLLLKDGDKEMQDSRDSAAAVGNVFAQQGPSLVLPLSFHSPAGESHDAHQSMQLPWTRADWWSPRQQTDRLHGTKRRI